MFLTGEQIKSVAAGWVNAEETAEGLVFYRFTEEQQTFYKNTDDHLAARALGSASVTLDFWTDSPFVSVTADGWQCDTPDKYISLDLYENGEPRCLTPFDPPAQILWPELTPVAEKTATAQLQKGERRVTVYLPWNMLTRIRSVELAEGASFRPYTAKRKWIAFGDSITQGVRTEYASLSYVNRVARMLDAQVLNLGIGGDVMRDAGLLPHTYPDCEFVTSAFGTNDYSKDTEEFFSHHMPAYLHNLAAQFPNIPVFILLPLWRGMEDAAPEKPLGTLQEVRHRIAREAAKYENMTVIDCQHFLPHDAEFYGDTARLHPNARGFACYADALYRALKDKI